MWERRNEIDFPTNLEYMMDNIDRFAKPDFVPANEDVLHARQRTTGVVETVFTVRMRICRLLDSFQGRFPAAPYFKLGSRARAANHVPPPSTMLVVLLPIAVRGIITPTNLPSFPDVSGLIFLTTFFR
jgi:hypothetical protein